MCLATEVMHSPRPTAPSCGERDATPVALVPARRVDGQPGSTPLEPRCRAAIGRSETTVNTKRLTYPVVGNAPANRGSVAESLGIQVPACPVLAPACRRNPTRSARESDGVRTSRRDSEHAPDLYACASRVPGRRVTPIATSAPASTSRTRSPPRETSPAARDSRSTGRNSAPSAPDNHETPINDRNPSCRRPPTRRKPTHFWTHSSPEIATTRSASTRLGGRPSARSPPSRAR